jgi:hypothetical protein
MISSFERIGVTWSHAPLRQGRNASCDLKLHLPQVRQWHTFFHSQDLDTNHLIAFVEIEHNSRLHLFRLDNPGVIQTQLEGVGVLIIAHFHGLPLSLRSK